MVYRFLDLPHVRRAEIAQAFGFYTNEDQAMPESDWHASVFKRAAKQGLLDSLYREIDRHYGHVFPGRALTVEADSPSVYVFTADTASIS